MKILLNPKYEHLREYMMHLEEHFNQDGEDIHNDRNHLKKLRVEGLTLCVKKFAPTPKARRLKEILYKASKGKQAYLRPMLLRERGFESPESIALVKYRKGLLGQTTYFVCLHSPYRFSMADLHTLEAGKQQEVIAHFARYAAHLHEGGFLHRDFSSSNILYDVIDGRYHFSLIDTNNIKCGAAVHLEEGCKNLGQLSGDDAFFKELATRYAHERHADAARCLDLINEARHKKA